MSKKEVVTGDKAWEATGMRMTQSEYEELRALQQKSETQILSSQEQYRRSVLEKKKRELG